MWERIKTWFGVIAGAVVGFLLLLLGVKNRKIDKLETEVKTADVETRAAEVAHEKERETVEAVAKVEEKEEETMQEVSQGKKSYNDLIKEWNDEK